MELIILERLPKKDTKIPKNHENKDNNNLPARNYFISKIDMRKFDGNNLITWLFHLHQVATLQKVNKASMYLEQDQFLWYQWPFE